jgi:serine/threonine-protein kinase
MTNFQICLLSFLGTLACGLIGLVGFLILYSTTAGIDINLIIPIATSTNIVTSSPTKFFAQTVTLTPSIANTPADTLAPSITNTPTFTLTPSSTSTLTRTPTHTPQNTAIQLPTSTYNPNLPPAGATAICNDGTYSYSQHRRGTCSHHGGVRVWLVNLPP